MSLSDYHGIRDLWRETTGDSRICVAVIDGVVDLEHACFSGADLKQFDADAGSGRTGQTAAHGTLVTSVIFGQHGSIVEGVAPGCRGILIPIFSERRRRVSQLSLSAAICKAVELGAHIVNISSGQLTYAGESEDLLVHAIEAAHKKNVLIVAAAGNDRDPERNRFECLHVPAALPTVLTAGAMDENGYPLDCSCWAPAYQAQGVLALGKDVLGAIPGGGARRWTGTSLATPVVTGVAALLLSWQLKQGRRPDPHAVRVAILAGAQACDPTQVEDCSPYMAGRLDGIRAMKILSKEGRMSEQSEAAVMTQAEPMMADAAQVFQQAAAAPAPVAAAAPAPTPAARVVSMPPPAGTAFRSVAPSAPMPAGVAQSACECEGSKGLVFFIGLVGYDFGTEARRDTFKQQMPPVLYKHIDETHDAFVYPVATTNPKATVEEVRDGLLHDGFIDIPANAFDTRHMAAYLKAYPSEARALIWTLNLELTPVYAVEPVGPFAASVYEMLVDMLAGQSKLERTDEYVQRVSVPADLTDHSVRLFSGQEVTTLLVDAPRGMYMWNTDLLLKQIGDPFVDAEGHALKIAGAVTPRDYLEQVLNKLYYEYRNLGVTSPDRALNYAATNIFLLTGALVQTIKEGKTLERIDVVKSPYCRVDSDCWDVQLKFLDPENTNRAYTVLRFSVDVSDRLPVTLGKLVTYISAS